MTHTAFAVLIFLFVSVIPGLSQSASDAELSDEDRRVAVAVLEHAKPGIPPGAALLDSTVSMCDSATAHPCISPDLFVGIRPEQWPPAVGPRLRAGFIARNQHPVRVGSMGAAIRIVDGERVRAMIRNRNGRRLSEIAAEFPGVQGFVELSVPAYSADGEWAVVYLHSFCEGRCGWGAVRLLRREKGRWIVERSVVNWQG